MGKSSANKSTTALEWARKSGEREIKYGENLLGQAQPALTQALNSYSGLTSGNVPGITKYVAPQMQDLEAQYAQAEKQIDAMPAGGARDAAKRDLILSKAGAKNRLFSGGVQSGLSGLSNLALNTSNVGLSALSGGQGANLTSGDIYRQMSSSKLGAAMGGARSLGGFVGGLG